MIVEWLEQALIASMSLTATYLSLHPAHQRFACFFGLCVQPLWMMTTFKNHQYGMFALCFVYGAIWFRSFWRHWVK